MIFNIEQLKQYLKLEYNVIFTGKHGVGKTTMVDKVFTESGYRWKYFSAATMDPWTELVGVPDISIDTETGNKVLNLVRPSELQNDELDAIFFDELNRAPDKVLNAVMELIQFKSINGHKFNNLKVIWAAINPPDEDETYKVRTLDPAQMDRFHVQLDIPYELDKNYLASKYPLFYTQFCEWWTELPDDQKFAVSPRRLDYAMHAFQNDCRLEDFLPVKSNVKKLRESLKTVPFSQKLISMSSADVQAFLSNGNNATKLLDMAKNKDPIAVDFLTKNLSLLPKELVASVTGILSAISSNATIVASLKDFCEKLNIQDSAIKQVEYINSVDFEIMYGKSTEDIVELFVKDLELIEKSSPADIQKIRRSIRDIVFRSSNLKSFLTNSKTGLPSNLHNLLLAVTLKKNFNSAEIGMFNNKLLDCGFTSETAYLKV
jgi:hypothetical protein